MQNLSNNYINQETRRVMLKFCSFSYSDLEVATSAALEAGKTSEFVYEKTQEFSEDRGVPINKCDPVYCVYETILEEARNEVKKLINYDFINDFSGNGEEINVYGDFFNTDYFGQEGKEELKAKLEEAKIKLEDLSEATQWFLYKCKIAEQTIKELKA